MSAFFNVRKIPLRQSKICFSMAHCKTWNDVGKGLFWVNNVFNFEFVNIFTVWKVKLNVSKTEDFISVMKLL